MSSKEDGSNDASWLFPNPKYTEVYLFLTSLTIVLVCLYNQDQFYALLNYFSFGSSGNLKFMACVIVFIFGMFLSVFYAFSKARPSKSEKGLMLFFIVMANAVVGFSAAGYILANSKGLFIIFPLINIVQLIFLLVFFRTRIINENNISDKNAKLDELILGSCGVLIVFYFGTYVLLEEGSIVASACLVCSSMIDRISSAVNRAL